MKFKMVYKLFVVLPFITCINLAHAGIITLQWETNVSDSDFNGISIGDSANFVFRFETATNDLADLNLNITNLLDYSVFFKATGGYVTYNAPGNGNSLYYPTNNYFIFDNVGALSSIQSIAISGEEVFTNIVDLDRPARLWNDGNNCILCTLDNTKHLDVDNASYGLIANNWTVSVSELPEPSTLAILALGLMGLASRRFKKK